MKDIKDKNPLQLEILVQGPGEAEKDLIIAGFFEYEENEPELIGGAKQLNDGLQGKVMHIRRTAKAFVGQLGETHLFRSPANTIPGKNVMLVGLGPLKDFNVETAKAFGTAAFLRANMTNFTEVCLAPEIKDAGVNPYDGHAVTIALIEGIMLGYQKRLANNEKITIKKFFLLAGKANEENARNGLRDGLRHFYHTKY